VIQAAAQPQAIEAHPINVRDPTEIERGVTAFAAGPGTGGLIVVSGTNAVVHRDLIVKLAAKHKLATVYAQREFIAAGGLISYGTNLLDLLRSAAGYVDRILKGEKLADLPVQAPVKYELVVNLKTAKGSALPCLRPCSSAPTR
jgi:putative tryptophan/tyrosine transport system substrate-binding protein